MTRDVLFSSVREKKAACSDSFRLFGLYLLLLNSLIGSPSALALPKCDDNQKYRDQCFGSFKFEQGHSYTGSWKEDQFHGQGNLYTSDGNVLRGLWDMGSMQENSIPSQHLESCPDSTQVIWDDCFGDWFFGSDGNRYVGEWKADLPHGFGYLYYAQGGSKTGYFRRGELVRECESVEGWAECITFEKLNNDRLYVGPWRGNVAEGVGFYINETGGMYLGEMKQGVRFGEGIFVNKTDEGDFAIFLGRYEQGDRFYGVEITKERVARGWWNGSTLEKPDLREWADVVSHTDDDGNKFFGQLVDGFRNGYGIYWRDDFLWAGLWRDGQLDGPGLLFDHNAHLSLGYFRDGKYDGLVAKVSLEGLEISKYSEGSVDGFKYLVSGPSDTEMGSAQVTYWENGRQLEPLQPVEQLSQPAVGQNGQSGVVESQITPSIRPTNQRIALVIGNAAYAVGPLKNPVNDASIMAQTLRQLGFNVRELTNLNQKQMKVAIRDFGQDLRQAGPDATGLFFFSGHGMQNDGINYMIPLGAEIRSKADVDIEAVGANAILAQMEEATTGVNIVILDACRTNSFSRGFKSSSAGLAPMDAPTGTIVAYATAPGRVAYDGRGNYSPYVTALVQALKTPNLKVEEVFKEVRRMVVQTTNEDQVPWEASSLIGDFVFNRED